LIQIGPDPQKVLVVGDFRSGKTTLDKVIVQAFPRAWIWDSIWEFGDVASPTHTAAYPGGRAAYQPYAGTDLEAAFNDFCRIALMLKNTLVVIDEPSRVLDSHSTVQSFDDFFRLGHKMGNTTLVSTHQYKGDLPKLTRRVHHVFAFRITDVDDADNLRGLVGKEGVAWIVHAPKYHYWHVGAGHNGPCKPLPLPRQAPQGTPGNAQKRGIP
jgi:hypothetical protein